MLTIDQIENYKQNGLIIIPNLIDTKKLDKILDQAKMILGAQIEIILGHKYYSESHAMELFAVAPEVFKSCGRLIQQSIPLHKLQTNSLILKIVKELGVKSPIISTKCIQYLHHKELAEQEVNYKSPPHKDLLSMRSSINSIVVWLPLVSCMDKEIGALRVVPGSHLITSDVVDVNSNFVVVSTGSQQFVDVHMEKGSVLFFNAHLTHRSGANTSTKIRHSVSFRYGDTSSRDWIERGYENPYRTTLNLDNIDTEWPSQQLINKVLK